MFDKLRELIGVSADEKPTLEEVGCIDAYRAIHGELPDDGHGAWKHDAENMPSREADE